MAGAWGKATRARRDRIGSIVEQLGLSDITSFPGSLSREILPADDLVAVEAMACGTPVVVSQVGGLKYTVVPRETGLLAPPKNEVVFAGAIDRL